jgi:processive 1,2-diacylglycerol beta-glucosyltransferase/1,2-diacylglycerol 3-beta-galactosyltransferase
MNPKKKKILFLFLKTGGGHEAPARAIAKYLNKHKNDEIETILFDGFEKSKRIAKLIVVDGYRFLQNNAKWIFELIYAVHKIRLVSEISAYLVSINTEKYLRETIKNENPDKIVILHFFLIKPVYNILKSDKLNIPVITVVTDPYSAHPLWFLNKDQNFIVFSGQLRDKLIRDGINERNINVFPFILDEKFSKRATPEEIIVYKKKYEIKSNNVLLVLGGGDGIPHGLAILNNILKLNIDFEILIVCGKDKNLFDEAVKLKEKLNDTRLKVFGFVDFVYELISVSDVIISKCGASTFMEILLSRKVPIINSYIWEQEKGNVVFLVENELGIYEKNIFKLPEIVKQLFQNKSLIEKYKNNNEKMNLVNGADQVAEFIAK